MEILGCLLSWCLLDKQIHAMMPLYGHGYLYREWGVYSVVKIRIKVIRYPIHAMIFVF